MRARTASSRLVVAAVVCLVSGPAAAAAPKCNAQTCTRRFTLNDARACSPLQCCWAKQSFWCATGEPAGGPACDAFGPGGCAASCSNPTYTPLDSCSVDQSCTLGMGSAEKCNTPEDDNYDGCINEGCTITKYDDPACKCAGACKTPTCSPPTLATCDPSMGKVEICGNGKDDDCDGVPDDGCLALGGGMGGGGGGFGPCPSCTKERSGGDSSCPAKAGADPIVLPSQAAVTEPFEDFSATAVTALSLTRTYSSADSSLRGGPVGPFGRGWHHEWEGTLGCQGEFCTVGLGLVPGFTFQRTGTALSLDGTETWEVFRPATSPSLNRNLLVRRPGGLWTLFFASGRELHFASVCDACGGPDAFCVDPLAGGTARVVRAVGANGETVHVSRDRPSGLLLGISDDLGHSLEARSATACTDGLARELRYDGMEVATYEYQGPDLVRAVDAEGAVLRAYAYAGDSGRLLAVLNEAGRSVTEFSYDGEGRAIGVFDAGSSVAVSYPSAGVARVTEFYGDFQSTTGDRTLDPSGRILSISEGCACGPAATYTWSEGNLACSKDSLGHVTWQEFDALGRLTRRAEFKGTTCAAPSPLLTEIRDERRAYGLTRTLAQGLVLDLDTVTSTTRPSALQSGNASVTWSYDPTPDAIDPAGYSCQQAPLPVGSVVCREIEAGYVYDRATQRVFERHATFFSYDARGRLVRKLGPVNLDRPSASDVIPVEERVYWGDTESLPRRGRLREVRRYASPSAAPLVTRFDHDAFGPFQITGPDGGRTTIVRDARGRPRYVGGPDGRVRETRYYDGLSPRLELLASGAAVRTSYGPFGLPTSVESLSTDPEAPGATPVLGGSEHYLHDAAGNRTRTERRDGSGAVTFVQERAHDVRHRVLRESHPELPGAFRTWDYDASGFLTRSVDEQGRTTTFTPDGLNRVRTVTRSGLDAGGAPVSLAVAAYTYESRSDALRQVKDGRNAYTSYKQDDFGLRTNYVSSYNLGGGQIDYRLDARGNVLQRKDSYVTIDWIYDGLDRVLTVSARNSADGNTVAYTFAYDAPGAEGRLASVTSAERTVRYGYDPAGRLATETVEEAGIAVPLVTTYAHDPDGALSGIVYPSGLALTYVRDPATREVVRVVDGSGHVYADLVRRLPGGPIGSLTFGNGLPLAQAFNLRGEPLSVSSGPLSLAYVPSPAGDVASLTEGETTRTFTHDSLGRLTESPSWLSYGLDWNGNRTSETVEGVTARYQLTYDRVTTRQVPGATAGSWLNELSFAVDNQGAVGAVKRFAANGSTVTGATCFRHDALGRLVFAGAMKFGYTTCPTDAGVQAPIARFQYDARNRRVARFTAATGEWTHFLHDPSGALLSEMKRTGDPLAPWAKVRDYVWLDGRPLAQVEYVAGVPHRYAVHLDAIGLPRALTSQAGLTVWSATPARPYGDLVETTTFDPVAGRTVGTNLRLPGQYDERLLGGVGLQGPYYNWHRWYLPSMGRYLELDPIALDGGMNGLGAPDWYNYALGNPLTYTDPDGRQVAEATVGGAAICGLPCAVAGFLAGAAAAALLGKMAGDIAAQCASAGTCTQCICMGLDALGRRHGPYKIGKKNEFKNKEKCDMACRSAGHAEGFCGT